MRELKLHSPWLAIHRHRPENRQKIGSHFADGVPSLQQMVSLMECGWLFSEIEAMGITDGGPVVLARTLPVCQALARDSIHVSGSAGARLTAEHFGEPDCQSRLTFSP